MMFGFAVILLLLSSTTFFLGANLLKVCYSVAEDPPDNLPSYELFRQVTYNIHSTNISNLGMPNTFGVIRIFNIKF